MELADKDFVTRGSNSNFCISTVLYSSSDMAHEIQNDEFGRVATNADTFRYDARGQVTEVVVVTNTFTHAYDEIGNHLLAGAGVTTNIVVNNALNQTTAFGGETITWNADGGMASDADWNYDYDAEDRLVAITSRSLTNGALRVHNGYDYRNRRIMKVIDRYDADAGEWNLAERRDFVWDDWNIVHETVATINGGTTNVSEIQYFWGSDLSGTLQGAGGVGGLLAVSRDGLFYFPVYDNNGSIMKYVDESGTIAADYLYDDFGRTISQAGELAESFVFGFSTKYLDRETDLVAYQRRFYSTVRKCWINRDPIEENGGVNLYGGCANNFIFNYDSLGESWLDCFSDCVEEWRLDWTEVLNELNILSLANTPVPKTLHERRWIKYGVSEDTTNLSRAISQGERLARKLPLGNPIRSKLVRGLGDVRRFMRQPVLVGIGQAGAVITVFEGFYDLGVMAYCSLHCCGE